MVILFINYMMKNTMKKILSFRKMYLVGALLMGISWTSCSDDNGVALPIELTNVTTIADMNTTIEEAALGDFIAVHGTGLDVHNIDSILIDDIKLDMQEVYTEDDILFIKIPVKLATKKTDKISIYNMAGCFEIPFKTVAPNLKLSRMFNEYTAPGDTIMIYGDFFNLYEIDSLNAVVDFNGKVSPVIKSANNYLTAKVPVDVDKNIKIKVKGVKYNVEAVCPGRYYDCDFMIMDFDEYLPSSMTNVVTDEKDPQRLSGNFLRIDDKSEYSSWWYIAERGDIPYTDDMLGLESCKNYVVKCEFRTSNQFIKDRIRFCNYLYWAAPTCDWVATDFNIQNFNRWETITLPFNVYLSEDYPDYHPGSYTSFNMRLEIDPEIARNFAFDNIRICRKGD